MLKKPADIPTIGRFAILQDPQGALFVAFTPLPSSAPRPDATPAVDDFFWHDWKGRTLGGMMNKPRQSPGPPAWLSYIKVADSKKAAAKQRH